MHQIIYETYYLAAVKCFVILRTANFVPESRDKHSPNGSTQPFINVLSHIKMFTAYPLFIFKLKFDCLSVMYTV